MLSGGTFPVLSKQKKGIYMSEKYKDTGLRPEERAKSLLEEMSLEEKMGQVNCVFPFDRVCFDYDYISEQTKYGIGESVPGNAPHGKRWRKRQRGRGRFRRL